MNGSGAVFGAFMAEDTYFPNMENLCAVLPNLMQREVERQKSFFAEQETMRMSRVNPIQNIEGGE